MNTSFIAAAYCCSLHAPHDAAPSLDTIDLYGQLSQYPGNALAAAWSEVPQGDASFQRFCNILQGCSTTVTAQLLHSQNFLYVMLANYGRRLVAADQASWEQVTDTVCQCAALCARIEDEHVQHFITRGQVIQTAFVMDGNHNGTLLEIPALLSILSGNYDQLPKDYYAPFDEYALPKITKNTLSPSERESKLRHSIAELGSR